VPGDSLSPIYNLFDRRGGGRWYSQRVSRSRCQDFRGGTLTYDEHDGTDFVCPIGTRLVAAAPGTVVFLRDNFLRGGLTVGVDHGFGVVTQYTHCSRSLVKVGDVVRRGDPVALSGAAGIDLVQFFPFVPPHIHFMVSVDGAPIDPFTRPAEPERLGTWLERNDPRPSGPRADDPAQVEPSPVDGEALARVVRSCKDARVRAELHGARDQGPALAALVEEALHHDRYAFPVDVLDTKVRPTHVHPASAVRLSLPFSAEDYRGACFGDSWFTEP
jgi:hypothetical protein